MKQQVKLMLGDNISSLKKLPDNSIDSVVTDGPYGLTFMNKKWDYDVPSVQFWKEVYRVLKPGGHVLSFGGTRTYHRMAVNIEDAGFEIRDQIMWLYGSGFPKSHNISKAIDKVECNERKVIGKKIQRVDGTLRNKQRNGGFMKENVITKPSDGYINIEEPGSENSKRYEGWGTALKPANEPICLARKPLSEKSVAENVLKWKTGGINVDGCRVGTDDNIGRKGNENDLGVGILAQYDGRKTAPTKKVFDMPSNPEGRFPANIILECCCDEVIKGESGEIKKTTRDRKYEVGDEKFKGLGTRIEAIDNYNDKGDIHTNPMCPCRLLDEQSGFSKTNCKAGIVDKSTRTTQGAVFVDKDGKPTTGHKQIINASTINDKGGASRFFYQAKVSKAERNMGLDEFEEKEKIGNLSDVVSDSKLKVKNNHPTVKPINLMTYLCRLITPEGGIVLDPFMGSGSTGIAARLEGFRFLGMEMDADYFKIAEARIENFEQYRKFLKKI